MSNKKVKQTTFTSWPTFKYNFIQIWGLLFFIYIYMYIYIYLVIYPFIYMYIYFFDSLNLLLMFVVWISVVLQSLRPKNPHLLAPGGSTIRLLPPTTPSHSDMTFSSALPSSLSLSRPGEAERVESLWGYCCRCQRIGKEQSEELLLSG